MEEVWGNPFGRCKVDGWSSIFISETRKWMFQLVIVIEGWRLWWKCWKYLSFGDFRLRIQFVHLLVNWCATQFVAWYYFWLKLHLLIRKLSSDNETMNTKTVNIKILLQPTEFSRKIFDIFFLAKWHSFEKPKTKLFALVNGQKS